MTTNLIYTLEIFIFIFCLLNIINKSYNLLKVMRQQDGKIDTTTTSKILLGLSISYVITALIIGF